MTAMTELTDEQLTALTETMNRAADAIVAKGGESVVIIVTASKRDGLTTHSKIGRGNYYAQRGSAIEWIDSTKAAPDTPPPSPEEGDWWKS